MRDLIVTGDLLRACRALEEGTLPGEEGSPSAACCVVVLSGFPCCVDEDPPTETDGPPGACAIAQAALALMDGSKSSSSSVVLATDECNKKVFEAASKHLKERYPSNFSVEAFPPGLSCSSLEKLAERCTLLVACERAGPASDGNCYTMRALNMTERNLIAPLHDLVAAAAAKAKVPFVAVGDGGNELGMGKVIEKIRSSTKIKNGDKIGCVVAANHLVAASVSNWGGYALAAGAAYLRAKRNGDDGGDEALAEWVSRCVPSEAEEVELLGRCVKEGCRDGVSGKVEATVDGMPLETSLKCLRDVTATVLSTASAST